MRRRVNGTTCLCMLLASCGLARAGMTSGVGESPERALAQPIDLALIDGRDFAGLRLGVSEVPGPLAFEAASGWSWVEGGGARPVHRLALEGDVRVVLAAHEFHAARALVWLERVEEPSAAGVVYQVFAYFDRVGTPTAPAGVSLTADRLPVRARVRLTEESIRLRTDRLVGERRVDGFVREGERALASLLRAQALDSQAVFTPGQAGVDPRAGPIRPGLARPGAPPAVIDPQSELAQALRSLPPDAPDPPIFARSGLLGVSGDMVAAAGDEENVVLLPSGIVAQYWDRESGRTLQLSAERGVVFLPPGPLRDMTRLSASDVRGVYLEGDVRADDGQYSLRAPRVYYDIQRNKALLLDAVFSTFDQKRGSPLYLRASALRQHSEHEFSATSATVSNTAFFSPHFSIGATSLTLSRKERQDGEQETILDARNITLRGGPVPFFYWPIFVGDPQDIPLRELSVENSNQSGTAVRTAWDLKSLLGLDGPENVSAELLLDGYFKRGLGIGMDTAWRTDGGRGSLFAYTVPDDTGMDVFSTGARVDRDGEFRGVVTAEHQQNLTRHWSIFAEGWHASDPAFIDAFYRDWGSSGREFENSVYARRLEENTALTLQAKGAFDDFTPNQYLLQSRGYTVEKLPEAVYTRIADDVFPDTAPGLVSYSSETRVGRMSLAMDEVTAAQRGLRTNRLAQDVLGLENSNESVADRLRREGYTGDDVYRFDTRHEVSMPMEAGPVMVTPFVVGRATIYDDTFTEFDPNNDDSARLWGALGVRAHTSLETIDNSVDSRLFDLHRLRHVVEPHVTLWHAGTTIDHTSLPVYDAGVESIAEGTVWAFGVDQRFETERGGPGRWRKVEVLTISTDLVVSSDDVDRASPIGRYIDYRPEYSNLGDFANVEAAWNVSDAVVVAGALTYDFDASQPVKSSLGLLVRHGSAFSTYAEIRHIDPEDSTFYLFAATLELTPKYSTTFSAALDGDDAKWERAGVEVRRRFPNALVGVGVNYDNLRNETSLGFSVTPLGLSGRAARLRGLGSAHAPSRSSRVGG